MNAGDPVEWYLDIPVVSRAYLTLSFLTTAACALDVVSPFSLYFNSALIWQKGQVHTLTHIHTSSLFGKRGGATSTFTPMLLLCLLAQVWRLATNFMFFGAFGIDFVFHMYFMCRYSRLLEENSFRGRTADFVWMLMFGAAIMTVSPSYCKKFSALLLWSLMPLSRLLFWPLSACCTLCEHSLSWLLTDIHDGLRLGSTQSLRANEVATSQPAISATLHPHPPPCSNPLPPPTRFFLSVAVPAFWVCSHSTPLTCPGCCFPSPTCWGAPPRR